jgi:hypothetical protein
VFFLSRSETVGAPSLRSLQGRERYCRDRSLSILEQTRERYRFVLVGYVIMPEHIHLAGWPTFRGFRKVGVRADGIRRLS